MTNSRGLNYPSWYAEGTTGLAVYRDAAEDAYFWTCRGCNARSVWNFDETDEAVDDLRAHVRRDHDELEI